MSWGRGFLRAWLVLAVAWCALTIIGADHSIDPARGFVPAGCEAAETARDCDEILKRNGDQYALFSTAAGNPAYAAERRQRAAWPWQMAFLPPLSVLAFGVIARWVLMGFTRREGA